MSHHGTARISRELLRPVLATVCAISIVGFSLIMLTGCGSDQDANAELAGEERQGAPGGGRATLIRVRPIEKKDITPKVAIVGTIVPKKVSIVASGADGLVDDFHAEEGQFVEVNDPLSVLRTRSTDLGIEEAKAVARMREQEWMEMKESRPEEIAEAAARLSVAEVALRNAQSKLKRARELYDTGAIDINEYGDFEERSKAAAKTYDAVKAVYDRIKSGPREEQVAQAKARYEAQLAQVAYLEAEKAKRTVTAPFNGFVVKEQTYVGQWLSKGDSVVTLAMLDEVDVIANVVQWNLKHVRVGQTVDVKIRGAEPEVWKGRIISVVPRSQWTEGSRGFPVKVRIRNVIHDVGDRKVPTLKEGMIAEVIFEGEPVNAILAPKDAIIRTTDGNTLNVFLPDSPGAKSGTFQRYPVQTGLSEGDMMQVHWPDLEKWVVETLARGQTPLVITEGGERLQQIGQVMLAPERPPAGGQFGTGPPGAGSLSGKPSRSKQDGPKLPPGDTPDNGNPLETPSSKSDPFSRPANSFESENTPLKNTEPKPISKNRGTSAAQPFPE